MAWLMVSPTLLIVLSIALIPVLATVYLSLHHATVARTGSFTGLANYGAVLRDPIFSEALTNTAVFTVVSVVIELIIGLTVALVLNSSFRGRGLVRATVLLPWAFPLSIAAVLARLMLQDQVGIGSYLARSVGLIHGPILSSPGALLVVIIIVDVWTSTPFMAFLLLAGLQAIPGSLYEAAEVDGAGPFQRLLRITLPLLKPSILVALLFRTLQAWAVYDLFYVMALNQTNSISTYVYQDVRGSGLQFGPGAAAAVLTFVSSLFIAGLFLKTFGARTVQET
jgi:multiple sugar transport system permease protein